MATTIKITSGTHSTLRQETLRVSAAVNVRLSMEAVIIALLRLAARHPDEMISLAAETTKAADTNVR